MHIAGRVTGLHPPKRIMIRAASLPPAAWSPALLAPPTAALSLTPPPPSSPPFLVPPLNASTADTDATDRFASAYRSQIGHLKRVHEHERRSLQADVTALRNTAYGAHMGAAHHRTRANAAREALGTTTMQSAAIQQALSLVRAEIATETAALAASHEAVKQQEIALADLKLWASSEVAELNAQCAAAHQRRKDQEQRASELAEALATAQRDRLAASESAAEQRRRAEAAVVAKQQALNQLRTREADDERALACAAAALEADFAAERERYRKSDEQTRVRLSELQVLRH